MSRFYNKESLYIELDRLRNYLEINDSSYPVNIIKTCENLEIASVGYITFATPALRGMAVISSDVHERNDLIALREGQNKFEQNFFCGHELIHLMFHRDHNTTVFKCYENTTPAQDIFLEWQANEGSAELLVPYKQVLAHIKANEFKLKSWEGIFDVRIDLANMFGVSTQVIENRLESLKYEIHQHLCGASLNDLKILSSSKQKAQGIHTESLNSKAVGLMAQDFFDIQEANGFGCNY